FFKIVKNLKNGNALSNSPSLPNRDNVQHLAEKNKKVARKTLIKIPILAKILMSKMNKGSLFKELFVNIKTTGAVTFSSKSLVNKMLSFANFSGAKIIVELGGGDGSITRGIVERMDKDAVLLVFEI